MLELSGSSARSERAAPSNLTRTKPLDGRSTAATVTVSNARGTLRIDGTFIRTSSRSSSQAQTWRANQRERNRRGDQQGTHGAAEGSAKILR